MPFRTPDVRTNEDIGTISGPEWIGPDGEAVPTGLDEGEWVRYWKHLPHSLIGRITSLGTIAKVDPGSMAVAATFDPGAAGMARVRLGIVGWNLLADGKPVPWEAAKAAELLDGLPDETFALLQRLIGEGEHRPLAAPADPDNPEGPTLGEG